MRRLSPGAWGWVGLAAYVIVFDNLAPDTLSSAFWRGMSQRRLITIAAWGVVTSHLFIRTPLPLRVVRRKH